MRLKDKADPPTDTKPTGPLADGVHVWPQAEREGYRADFLIFVQAHVGLEGRFGAIVVECDGHEFHERTKEQAMHDRSRDRALASAGYLVVRFTGAELYRNPERCASELAEMIRDQVWPRWKAGEELPPLGKIISRGAV